MKMASVHHEAFLIVVESDCLYLLSSQNSISNQDNVTTYPHVVSLKDDSCVVYHKIK